MKYQIIYADPPWDYRGQNQNGFRGGDVGYDSGGAILHYSTMKAPELKNLGVEKIADKDCLLFLWVTSPCLEDGFTVAKAWGFKYATVAFVWDKKITNPSYYTLSQIEMCLVFKKGKIPTPRGARNIRQFLSMRRAEHSQKPEEIRNRIMAMFPKQKKIELFARERTSNLFGFDEYEGWDVWGNQIKSDIEFSSPL